MTIEVLLRFMVRHAFALAAVPKNLAGLGIGESHLEGESTVKLDLVK